eukprot:s4499_g3.t5
MSGALLQSSSRLRLAMPIAAPVKDDAWPVFDWSTTTATTPFSFFLGLGCSGLLARAVALGDLVVTLRLHQEMGGSALLGPCCSSATLCLYQAMGDGTLQALAALRRLCGFTWRWATEHFRLLLLFGDSVASPGSSWPVRYQDVLNLALSAEAWREHGDKAEFALPPRKPMPVAMLNRLTPSKPPSGPARVTLPNHLTVLSTGHHASYPVAISAMWRALLPEYEIQIQDHSFDDRYCQLHGTCSADSRFAWLGEHLRGTLVRTCGGHYLKGFEDIESLAEHFFELVVKDPTTSQVDLLLCTHPPYSCRLFWPFVQRLGWPLLGFFGGTLEAHVPEEGMTAWLQDFQAMACPSAQDARVQFAAIAPFLAEKMRFQSGVDIPASRGFGFHVIEQGGSYFPRRWDEVLLWKGSSECADNEEAFNDAISAVSKSVSEGSSSDVLLRFMHLRELRESVERASYSSITSFRAVVFVPYEVLLMTFYELYHAAIPLFIPEKEIGVFFMYRGPVTFPHCDLVLSKTDETGQVHSTTRQMPPYSPFNRQNVEARLSWLEAYTDWYRWPHNQRDVLMSMLLAVDRPSPELFIAGVAFEHLLFFDVAYCGAILFFILMQVPRRVVRDNDSLKIVTRLVPIESLVEIRIVRRRRCCDKQGRLCIYPGKCFWGYPTSFDQNVIVVTDSCCNNYFFCLHDMEEFVLDNWPALEEEGEADEPVKVQVEPAMIGSKQYSSVADLVWKLYETDLQAVSAAMRSETARAMVGASAFWKAAFEKVLAASRGGF